MRLDRAKAAIGIAYRAPFFELMRHGVYNSYMYTALFSPHSATFNITEKCNSKCITCNIWRHTSANELTFDEMTDILVQLRNLGILNIHFAGGEPLLRKDLPELVKKSKELGFRYISLVTNGLLINEQKAEELIDNGLSRIAVSIDGIGEVHDKIRGIQGAFERSLSALKTIVKLRDEKYPKLYIAVATTLMRPNIDQIENIVSMCNQLKVRLGLNLPDVSPYFFSGIDISELVIKDQRKLDSFIDKLYEIKKNNPFVLENQFYISLEYARKYFTDPKRKDIPCIIGYENIYIGAHGNVYSGCWVLKSIGDLRKDKLEDIINSKNHEKRLFDMFTKKCPGCSCGYNINLIHHAPSIYREIINKFKN